MCFKYNITMWYLHILLCFYPKQMLEDNDNYDDPSYNGEEDDDPVTIVAT